MKILRCLAKKDVESYLLGVVVLQTALFRQMSYLFIS